MQIFSIIILLILSVFIVISVANRVKRIYEYNLIIEKCSQQFSLDKGLIFGVIKAESNFNPNAKSSKNAYGLMQVKVETFNYVCQLYGFKFSKEQIYEPEVNILIGCAYLKYLFDKFKTQNEVLSAYNAGEGNVKTWLSNKNYSKNGLTLDIIPYKETNIYVKKVNKYQKFYKR